MSNHSKELDFSEKLYDKMRVKLEQCALSKVKFNYFEN